MVNDFLRNNSNAFLQMGAGLLGGRTAPEQVSMGLQGFASARQQQQQINKTAEMLRRQGDADLAEAIEAGMMNGKDAWQMAFERKLQAQAPKKPPLMGAGGAIYNYETGQWLTPPGRADDRGEEWGLNPVWGKDADGKTVLGQVSKSGKFKPLDTGGFTPTPGISNLDLGTSILTVDNRSGQPVAQNQKDLAGAEAQKEIGGARGRAEVAAPADYQAAQNALDLVNSLRNDPNRQAGTGKSSIFNRIPASPGYDYQTKVNQAKSGAFLSAIEQMRGMGQLSNAEGQTATAAVTRMDTATSEEEFLAALDDYEKVIRQALSRASKRMGMPPADDYKQRYGLE